jgi:DNA-binding Xre family transcriptional regulator
MALNTRVVRTNIGLLKKEIRAQGKTNFAKAINVHLSTINALLDDQWQRIERDTLERLCDHLHCPIDSLINLEPDNFWSQVLTQNSCHILRGVVEEESTSGRLKAPLEEQAKANVADFLQRNLPGISMGFIEPLESEAQIVEHIRNNNTVVIGSHRSNRFCEVAVTQHFGARSFDSSSRNRLRLPFWLVKPAKKYSSCFVETHPIGSEGPFGVYSSEHNRIVGPVDYWPIDTYLGMRVDDGHDAAIVLVVNRPFGTRKDVKLVVLAGVGRLGTLAATHALIRDYRDLEPRPEDAEVVAILDASYRKQPFGDDRTLVDFDWTYRRGGRNPIPLKQRRSNPSNTATTGDKPKGRRRRRV